MSENYINPFKKEELDKYQEFLKRAKSCFPNHMELKRLSEAMVNFELLLAIIFEARTKYSDTKEDTLLLAQDIAKYKTRNVDNIGDRTMFTDQLLYESEIAFERIIEKYICIEDSVDYIGNSTTHEVGPDESCDVELQGRILFEKEMVKDQAIIVQASKKTAKNKRQKSAENQILDLVQKGKSFEVLPKPCNTKNGIKRIVVRLSFDTLVNYIKSILPASATFDCQNDSVKVLFGKSKSQMSLEPIKQRVVFSRQ